MDCPPKKVVVVERWLLVEVRLYKKVRASRMSLPVKTFVEYTPPPPPPQGLTARTDNPSKGKINCHMTNVAFRPTRRNYICYKVSCFMPYHGLI